MARSQLTSEGAKCHTAAASLQSHAHRCLPRFRRVLSCSQHLLPELHSAAALSLDAHGLREALASVACDGSIATDIGGRQVPLSQGSHDCGSHALTAASHTLVVCSAAVSTCILSCTARLHRLLTLTASEKRSQASHAMAQSQLINGGVACHCRNWHSGTRPPLQPSHASAAC